MRINETSSVLRIGGKLTLETKNQLQHQVEAVKNPESWGYFASQRIDAAIHDKVPFELDGLSATSPLPAALANFLMDSHLQFVVINNYEAVVYAPWVTADGLSSDEWGTLKLRVTDDREPLLDAQLTAKILERAGNPYFYEGALLTFFRKVLSVPSLELVV